MDKPEADRAEPRRRKAALGGWLSRSAHTKPRTMLVAWLCALAICFQCIVVQSHVHATVSGGLDLQTAAASVEGTAAVQQDVVRQDAARQEADPARKQAPTGETPSSCFICQQMAIAGAAILPQSPALLDVQYVESREFTPTEAAEVASPSSHIWRSRAPPLPLQA